MIPRQTGAGILDAESGSKAYLGVQNHTLINLFTHNLCINIYTYILGHALHEKGLQRQKGVGPLVSSQEQRALLVPRFNRG